MTTPPGPCRFSPRLVASRPERLPLAARRGSLEDTLALCLELLPSEPDSFEAAAVAWHGRWCAELPGVGFAEAHETLAALEGLAGSDPATAGRALHARCSRRGLDEVAAVLDAWFRRRCGSVPPRPSPPAPEGPSAA